MEENWTKLTSEMGEDGIITISRDAHYEWDGEGNETLVYEHVDTQLTSWDIYAAIMNGMIDADLLFEDNEGLDYGEYGVIAWGHSATGDNEFGYIINTSDAETLNEENTVELYPLSGEWEADVSAAFDRLFGAE